MREGNKKRKREREGKKRGERGVRKRKREREGEKRGERGVKKRRREREGKEGVRGIHVKGKVHFRRNAPRGKWVVW